MKSHIGNKPAWLADPNQSVICVLSKQELDGMEEEGIQEIFRKQHIVVHDQFQPKLAFDKKGLKTLAGLKKIVMLHGV
jgi:hypothetical protein